MRPLNRHNPDQGSRVTRQRWIVSLTAALLLLGSSVATAQSRQPWSLQLSGEWVFPTKRYGDVLQDGSTPGWELQGRYTFGRFSVGAGYQRSTVFKSDAADLTGTISVAFLEPRYVVAVLGDRLAPYVAGRLGYGALLIRESPHITETSITYGGGAGVLIALVPRVAIDAGGQYFVANFGGGESTAGYVLARLGVSIGLF